MEVMDEIKEAEEKVNDMRTLKTTEVFRKLNRAGRKNFVALFANVKLCLAIARSKQKACLDALSEIEPDPAGAISQFNEDRRTSEEPANEVMLKYALELSKWIDVIEPNTKDMTAHMVEQEDTVNQLAEAQGDPAQDQPSFKDLEDEALRLTHLIAQNQDRLDALHQEIEENHLAHALQTFVDTKLATLQIEDDVEEGEQVIDTGFAHAEAEIARIAARFAELEVSRAQVEEAGASDALSYLEDDLTMVARPTVTLKRSID